MWVASIGAAKAICIWSKRKLTAAGIAAILIPGELHDAGAKPATNPAFAAVLGNVVADHLTSRLNKRDAVTPAFIRFGIPGACEILFRRRALRLWRRRLSGCDWR